MKGGDYYVVLFAHRSSFARVGWLVFFPFSFLPFRFFFVAAGVVVLSMDFDVFFDIFFFDLRGIPGGSGSDWLCCFFFRSLICIGV